jgi:ribonuclease-3
LDSGIPAVETFIEPLLTSYSNKVINQEDINDPKSMLQEWAQSNKLGTPRYTTIRSSGPDHAKIFTVEVQLNGEPYGQGQGSSKQSAAQVAAQEALKFLNLL